MRRSKKGSLEEQVCQIRTHQYMWFMVWWSPNVWSWLLVSAPSLQLGSNKSPLSNISFHTLASQNHSRTILSACTILHQVCQQLYYQLTYRLIIINTYNMNTITVKDVLDSVRLSFEDLEQMRMNASQKQADRIAQYVCLSTDQYFWFIVQGTRKNVVQKHENECEGNSCNTTLCILSLNRKRTLASKEEQVKLWERQKAYEAKYWEEHRYELALKSYQQRAAYVLYLFVSFTELNWEHLYQMLWATGLWGTLLLLQNRSWAPRGIQSKHHSHFQYSVDLLMQCG